VVVEGVQRHIEEGLAPKDAAMKAMKELSGPVVGIALGWLRCSSLRRSFGHHRETFQQFALTIAISVMLSAFNALTLSPALAGLLLRPKPEEGTYKRRGPLGKFFDVFIAIGTQYECLSLVDCAITKGALGWCCWQYWSGRVFLWAAACPPALCPDEDQGYIYVSMQLPIAASMERTQARLRTE